MESTGLYVISVLGAIVTIYALSGYIAKKIGHRKHRQTAQRRQRQRETEFGTIEDFYLNDFLSKEEAQRIMQLTATELLHEIRTQKITSEAVMRLYLKLSMHSHRKVNSVSHWMIPEAIARAKEIDKILKTTGQPVGPLHGLPISVKECIDVKGTDSTLGFTGRCFQISETDAISVRLLREAGAIPFVKTNIPQTLLLPESANLIFGTTLNPYNSKRTSGGSSGGESALIASGGSPLGLGTDIGGSIRIPAHFCGIYGIKTTSGRVSMIGCNTGAKGQEAVRGTLGPMARSTSDIVLTMKLLLTPQTQLYDAQVPPLPFNDSLYNSKNKLRIGYYKNDGFFEASSACTRAVDIAVQKLRELGHDVVEFEPEQVDQVFSTFVGLMTADGARTLLKGADGSEIEPALATSLIASTMPYIARQLVAGVLHLLGWSRLRAVLLSAGNKPVEKVWALQYWRKLYTESFIKKMRNEKIDIIIAPGLSIPAFPIGASKDLSATCSYTILYNVLNFPSGVVPITTVNKEDLVNARTSKKDIWDKKAALVDKDSEGLPVGVQVISYPWQDELVLRVMQELEDSVKFPVNRIPLENLEAVY